MYGEFFQYPISRELLPRSHEPVAGRDPQNMRSGRIRMKVQVTPVLLK
jgi:hypothetical protein